MEFKGTKGEWEVKHSESKNAFNIVGTLVGGHYKIARIPYLVTETLVEINKREKLEAEYNAKLISCAPEMLGLLQDLERCADAMFQHGEPSETYYQLLNKANELIKKVTS